MYLVSAFGTIQLTLYSQYGEIVDVRMPSLKYNTHRRFCYVQFRSPSSAYEATQLNDSLVGETLHLIVKISDPSKREARTGPVHEGREIHVSNIDWKATEDDLNELFLAYGKVESVRLPTKVGGGIKGFGFVVFASKVSLRCSAKGCTAKRLANA